MPNSLGPNRHPPLPPPRLMADGGSLLLCLSLPPSPPRTVPPPAERAEWAERADPAERAVRQSRRPTDQGHRLHPRTRLAFPVLPLASPCLHQPSVHGAWRSVDSSGWTELRSLAISAERLMLMDKNQEGPFPIASISPTSYPQLSSPSSPSLSSSCTATPRTLRTLCTLCHCTHLLDHKRRFPPPLAALTLHRRDRRRFTLFSSLHRHPIPSRTSLQLLTTTTTKIPR
jgi:hypothetical protein